MTGGDQDSAMLDQEEPLYGILLKSWNSCVFCILYVSLKQLWNLSREIEVIQVDQDPGGAEVNVVWKENLDLKDLQEPK